MDDLGYPNLGELHMKKSCQNAKVGFILFPSTRGRDWRIQALAQEDEDDEETEEFQEADEDEDEQVWRPAECHGVMVCQEMGYETNGEHMGRLWFSKALDFGVHTKFLVSRKWPVNILVYTPVIKREFLYFRSNEANCHVNKSPFSPEFYVSAGIGGNPRSRIKLSGCQPEKTEAFLVGFPWPCFDMVDFMIFHAASDVLRLNCAEVARLKEICWRNGYVWMFVCSCLFWL